MLIGFTSAVLIASAGYGCLRPIGLCRGAVVLGLAPAAGLAALAVLASWALRLGVPEPITGVAVLTVSVAGLALGIRDVLVNRVMWHCQRFEIGALLATVAIGLIVLGVSVSVRAGVPDYVHDGAHHAETIDALRRGSPLPGYGWYPSGFHAPVAALLSLLPGVDSAAGAVGWAAGVTLLGPLTVYGLTFGLWKDARVAAVAALLLALTYNFPYEPNLYSVWPMAAGLLIVGGLWTVTLAYLQQPGARLALLGGLMAGALVLTHGTEVYTAALGLLALAAACWRQIFTRRAAVHIGLAALCALAVAAPYIPAVVGWASVGGAVAVGADYFDFRHLANLSDPLQEALFWSSGLSSGLLMDLPCRLALLGLGACVALRRPMGTAVVTLVALFVVLVAMFRYVDVPLVKEVFAVTLPWGVDGRLLMIVPVLTAPLSGLAAVATADYLRMRSARAHADRWRRAGRRLLTLGIAVAVASVFLVAEKFSLQTGGVVTYSANDAAAFAWLAQHVQPRDLLMNDGAADAGIWAPYKASIPIVLPRTKSIAPDDPEALVRANLAQLDTREDVRAAACQLGITYAYRGEANSPSEFRQFPSLDELRANPALEQVFSSGDAAVFRTRLNCG